MKEFSAREFNVWSRTSAGGDGLVSTCRAAPNLNSSSACHPSQRPRRTDWATKPVDLRRAEARLARHETSGIRGKSGTNSGNLDALNSPRRPTTGDVEVWADASRDLHSTGLASDAPVISKFDARRATAFVLGPNPRVRFEHLQIRWSANEDDVLRKAWADGSTAAEIGLKLGRSESSVIGRAWRLRLPRRMGGVRPNPDVDRLVKQLWPTAVPARRIASWCNYENSGGVFRRVESLGLTDRVRGKIPQQIVASLPRISALEGSCDASLARADVRLAELAAETNGANPFAGAPLDDDVEEAADAGSKISPATAGPASATSEAGGAS